MNLIDIINTLCEYKDNAIPVSLNSLRNTFDSMGFRVSITSFYLTDNALSVSIDNFEYTIEIHGLLENEGLYISTMEMQRINYTMDMTHMFANCTINRL